MNTKKKEKELFKEITINVVVVVTVAIIICGQVVNTLVYTTNITSFLGDLDVVVVIIICCCVITVWRILAE